MVRFRFPVLVAAAALLLTPAASRAHSIQTDIQLLGSGEHSHADPHDQARAGIDGRIQLHSAFSSGEPARQASVRLIASQGAEPVLIGRTDAEGRLAFVLPPRIGPDAEIQVDAGAGHRDWIELSELAAGRLQAAGPDTALRGTLLSLAPLAGLGLLGGLVAAIRHGNRA